MFHKVKSVSPLDELRLCVSFAEGITKIYDIAPLAKLWKPFEQLALDPALFNSVSVDTGGYGVIWNDDLDLSSDELWENGTQIETPFDGLLSFADASALWGLSESALRKAVSYGKLVGGLDTCKFGKQWVVTTQAMEREYGQIA